MEVDGHDLLASIGSADARKLERFAAVKAIRDVARADLSLVDSCLWAVANLCEGHMTPDEAIRYAISGPDRDRRN